MTQTLEERFRNNLLCVVDSIEDACKNSNNPPVQPHVFSLLKTALENIPMKDTLNYFANHTWKYWMQIHDKNEHFIRNNVDVVLGVSEMDESVRKTIRSIINNEKMSRIIDIIKEDDARLLKQGTEEDELTMPYIWNALNGMVKKAIEHTIVERRKNAQAISGATYDLSEYAAKFNVHV